MCDMVTNILISLGTGIVSGILTGFITGILVTRHYQKKEKHDELYSFWMKYIFDVYGECGMHIPVELLDNLSSLGGFKGRFGQAINSIEEIRYPTGEDRELTEEEEKKIKNAMIALEELGKWNTASKKWRKSIL